MKETDRVGNYYNNMHEQYLSFYGNTFQAHRPADIEELLEYLNNQINFQEGENVLDAGCGVCGPAIFFAKKNNIYIEALTNSAKQIETARENIRNEHLEDKIKLKLGDFHLIDKYYPAEYFDKIIFLESFGHSHRKSKLIKAAFNVLKIGGYLYLKDYFASEINGSFKRRVTMRKAVRKMNRLYCYKLENLNSTLRIARKLGLKLEALQSPNLLLSNEDVVNSFEKANKINLYSSDFKPIIVEPFELKFKKIIPDTTI
jgi:cyclopropane fatty-acyl-phospholipid synthase-like methyltransferase